MKELNIRQVSVLFCLSIISLKFLIFPALMAKYSFNDVYLSAALSLAIDFVFVLIIVFILKNNPNNTFIEILEKGLGKIITKIITFALFLYFLAKTILTIKETHNYYYELLFESFPWIFFVLPLLLLLLYTLFKGIRPLGRTAEFFFSIVMIGTIITILLPLDNVYFDNMLPFCVNGIKPIVTSSFYATFGFADFLILIIFMGKIKFEKNTSKKIITAAILTDLLVLAFFVVFVALFGRMSLNESLAISDIPLHSNLPSINGRLEWVSIIVWTINLFIQTSLMIYCSKECFNHTFSFINKSVSNYIIISLAFIIILLLYLSLAATIRVMVSLPFVISAISIQFGVPLLLLLAHFIKRRNDARNYKKDVKK